MDVDEVLSATARAWSELARVRGPARTPQEHAVARVRVFVVAWPAGELAVGLTDLEAATLVASGARLVSVREG
jgi:hypothetical protein